MMHISMTGETFFYRYTALITEGFRPFDNRRRFNDCRMRKSSRAHTLIKTYNGI